MAASATAAAAASDTQNEMAGGSSRTASGITTSRDHEGQAPVEFGRPEQARGRPDVRPRPHAGCGLPRCIGAGGAGVTPRPRRRVAT